MGGRKPRALACEPWPCAGLGSMGQGQVWRREFRDPLWRGVVGLRQALSEEVKQVAGSLEVEFRG